MLDYSVRTVVQLVRNTRSCVGVALAIIAVMLLPRPAAALDWSTLFTAQDVRDRLTTEAGRQEALEFCRKLGISKVYVETYRDNYQAEEATLKAARDFFRQSGLRVSGCVTPTRVGKISSGWEESVCYTHRQSQEKLAAIFRFTAGLFDEIMIDDFFFTDCECSECSAAKGSQSWRQYREKLMLQVSRDSVLGPARAANPKVKVILKFPQWYDRFQERGYIPDQEAALYDRIWVGTELRDPASDEWGHKQQYEGNFVYRWLAEVLQRFTSTNRWLRCWPARRRWSCSTTANSTLRSIAARLTPLPRAACNTSRSRSTRLTSEDCPPINLFQASPTIMKNTFSMRSACWASPCRRRLTSLRMSVPPCSRFTRLKTRNSPRNSAAFCPGEAQGF